MKDALAATVTASLAILAVLFIFFASAQQDKRALHQENERLAGRIQLLESRVAALAAVTNALTTASPTNVAPAPAAPPVPNEPAADARPDEPVMPKAYQVPVYLGNQPVGLAWAIPTNVRHDPKTGRLTMEQVVRLPEEARGAFTSYVTNVVERPPDAGPAQVVEREWYADRGPYWPWWPVWYSTAASRPDGSDHGRPPSSRPPSSRPRPPSSGAPWAPVQVRAAPRASAPGISLAPRPGDPGIFVPPGLR